MPAPRDQLSWPVTLVLLAAVYVASWVAVTYAPGHGAVAAWWPGAGLSIVIVGLSPRRRWPVLVTAIAVVCTLANLAGGRELGVSAIFGVGDAAEPLIAGALLRRGDRAPVLESFEDLVRITVAALVGAVGIALVAPFAVGVVGDGSVWTTARTVYASHAASTLVIVPAALAIFTTAVRRRATWETPVQVAALVVVTTLVFAPGQALALSILPLPVLAWGALRLDLRTVTWEVAGFAVLVTYLSAMGGGPLGAAFDTGEISAGAEATLVQVYLLCTAVVATPFALAMDLRRRLLDRVTTSELLFRRNFTESLVGMVLMRSGARMLEVVDANDAAQRLVGGPDGERVDLRGRALGDLLETAEPLDDVARRMLSGELDGWRAQTGIRGRPAARVNVALSLLSREPGAVYAAQLVDVTAEHDARRRLEAAEKLTSATLDTTAALILVTDLRGVVLRVNGATTALTGFAEEELVGKEIGDMPFASPGSTGYPAGLPADPAGQVSRETDVVTRSGGRHRVVWNTGYVRDEQDRPTYVVITGTDLTAERTAAGLNQHLLDAATTTALIGIDQRGRITLFNSGAANLLGHDPQDMIGVAFTDLLDAHQLAERLGASGEDAFARLVAGIDGGGEVGARDWTWIGADRRRHTVSMTVSVAADAFAARVGYLCVGRDVTEARASQEMLVAALEKERLSVERMRQLDEAKNEFVSTVSHELRTPVTSIVGFTELLEDGTPVPPTPEQRPLLESIARNGQRLIMLCDDLLMLGGLDSGATHWERETLDLSDVARSAEEAIRPALTGRALELTVTCDPEPAPVRGDRAQLERVLLNLLGNAVKFTDDGGRIDCRVRRHDDEAWLTVSDTGIGVPVEEQERLFQRFFRSSTAQERAIQGTGLGLSIVAAIVAAHGGRIEVESAHLEGTTFTVRLPLAR